MVVHVGIYGSKAAKGFSAFNVCLVIVKIMMCNKKFPHQIKYKNNDHQTPINVDLTLIRHFCVSCFVSDTFVSAVFYQVWMADWHWITQSRRPEEEKWEREEEEWRGEWRMRRAVEEERRAAGEKGGERRMCGSCITQFQAIILISLPHFDF